MIEQAISHYRIIRKLGAGGMGEVYLAEDTTLDRRVALKLLPREHTQDEERLRRFKQEAKAASALNHPNILTIYEVGEADGRHFIATEFIDGETLRASLRRTGSMETGEALNVAAQVASALATAHEAGIVHRDIKPENIMVRRDGYVKVLDFGLAKLTETDAPQPLDTGAPTIATVAHTATGVVLGTAQYMSPEQTTGKKVDARSDIFSFGAVLYEIVAGERAFQGDSLMATLAAIINQEPKPLSAKVPTELAQVIRRCLRKDPARRYQTMADLKVALEDLREESRAGRHVRRLSPWHWTAAALLLLLLVGALFTWQEWRAPQTTEPLRAVALTTFPGQELYPSLSPDGNHVAFTWTGPRQDNTDIYVQQIGVGSPLRVTTDPRSDYNPVWSPDGRWIAFLRGNRASALARSDRELRLIPPLGGPERKLADVRVLEITTNPIYLDWCPDSTCLVVTNSTGEGKPDALFVVSVESGEKRQLTNPQPPVLADTSPAVSPDGQLLIFLRRATWGFGELYSLPLGLGLIAAAEPRRLTVAGRKPDYAAWMPDGKEILLSPGAVAGAASLWRLAVAGEGRPVRFPFVGEDGVMPAVSRPQPARPSRLVYVRSFTDENIWRVETSVPGAPASSAPAVSISSTKADIHPQLSPDGRRVAFTSTRSEGWEIWVAELDGSNAVQLTSLGAQATGVPRWSPDGEWITFASDAEGQFEIFVIPAVGGKPRRITSHPALEHVPSFSRDGKWIYFSSNRTGQYQVWKVPVSGGDPVQVTQTGGWISYESPDGADLYYTPIAAVSAPTPLWRVPTSGGQPVNVLEGVRDFAAALERGIYYIDGPAGEARLQFFDFATRRSTTVVRLGDLGDFGPGGLTASPDGRTVLYARRDSSVDDLMLVENLR